MGSAARGWLHSSMQRSSEAEVGKTRVGWRGAGHLDAGPHDELGEVEQAVAVPWVVEQRRQLLLPQRQP